MSARISDYALIGSCTTAALVGRNGSIDWMCVPRFDSPACFAALLGSAENGQWLLRPAAAHRSTRRYRPNTLILETRFSTASGTVLVTDFMPESSLLPLLPCLKRPAGRAIGTTAIVGCEMPPSHCWCSFIPDIAPKQVAGRAGCSVRLRAVPETLRCFTALPANA
jgi:GH15 family glucan-1,4-alpha-glucosidase